MAKQTFIGAYARQRRVGRPAHTHTPAPHATVPEPVEAQPIESLPQADSLTDDQPLPSVQDSISVADTSQVWLGELDGKMLRIDTPLPASLPDVAAPASQPAIAQPMSPTPAPKPLPTPEHRLPASDVVAPAAPANPAVNDAAAAEAALTPAPEPMTATPHVASDLIDNASETTASLQPSVDSSEPTRQAVEPSIWTGAAWEVDAFDVPQSVSSLFFDEAFFQSIANQMRESVEAGLRTMMITSATRGAGRSTVAIGTAIAAAATGIRVVLVDADLENPRLLEHLRLDSEADWVSALRQNESLESAAIYSIEDSLTLLPLAMVEERTLPVSPNETERMLQSLDGLFDLIVFDAPQVNSWATQQLAAVVDSSLIVRDTRSTSQAEISTIAESLRGQGLTGLGVVDNFCN